MAKCCAYIGLIALHASAAPCSEPTLFDGEQKTDCAGGTGGGPYEVHRRGSLIKVITMQHYKECRTGSISTVLSGVPGDQRIGRHFDGTWGRLQLAKDDVLVGTLTLYRCIPHFEFCGMEGEVHRGSQGLTEPFSLVDESCQKARDPVRVNVNGRQLVGLYGQAGDRVDQLGLLLAAPPPCKVTSASGTWVWKNIVSADTTESWHYGSKIQHAESNTKEWKESLSVTVKQGWKLLGAKGGIQITGEVAQSTSSQISDSMETDASSTFEVTFKEADYGKSVWQFEYTTHDTCEHQEVGAQRIIALTVGRWWMPCCVPGYALDLDQTTCKSADVMIPGGVDQGCKISTELI